MQGLSLSEPSNLQDVVALFPRVSQAKNELGRKKRQGFDLLCMRMKSRGNARAGREEFGNGGVQRKESREREREKASSSFLVRDIF